VAGVWVYIGSIHLIDMQLRERQEIFTVSMSEGCREIQELEQTAINRFRGIHGIVTRVIVTV
jgi:hypothetical protein